MRRAGLPSPEAEQRWSRWSRRTSGACPDARVDQSHQDIDDRVHDHDDEGKEHDRTLDDGEILVTDGIHRQCRHAGPREDGLGDDGAPRSWPNCRPRTVTTGMHALRKACLITTMFSPTPLARAVLMNSMFITSMRPDLTSRMVRGARKAPRQKAGSTKFGQVP